ncbi:MAG TPA: hypothetical protein VH023_04215 [Rhodopila sp.]|nr:hypothetical protein [Rhodopila sp.]
MTIRAVLMWYLGALVVIGGSGAAGYSAIKQHQAQVAEQEAEPPAALVATAATPVPLVASASRQPSAPQPAAKIKTAASPPERSWPPLSAARVAEVPAASTATAQPPAPPPLTWSAASLATRPWPSRPKALTTHYSSRKRELRRVAASSRRPSVHSIPVHRPQLYVAARVPSAPRASYYGYPGYYPYQPGYAYYSYYPRYPYYSTY